MTNDINTAILEVYKKIGYVPKLGKISMGNNSYKFAGEAEFIAAIRPAMIEAGITISPQDVVQLVNDKLDSGSRVQHRVALLVTYCFYHAVSKTGMMVKATGEGMDSGDKAFNKAMTGALKYALRQTFLIETGDDPDKYASHEDGGIVEDAKAAKDAKQSPKEAKVPLVHHSFKNYAERNRMAKELLAGIEASDDPDYYYNMERAEDFARTINGSFESQVTVDMAIKSRKEFLANKQLQEAGLKN